MKPEPYSSMTAGQRCIGVLNCQVTPRVDLSSHSWLLADPMWRGRKTRSSRQYPLRLRRGSLFVSIIHQYRQKYFVQRGQKVLILWQEFPVRLHLALAHFRKHSHTISHSPSAV